VEEKENKKFRLLRQTVDSQREDPKTGDNNFRLGGGWTGKVPKG